MNSPDVVTALNIIAGCAVVATIALGVIGGALLSITDQLEHMADRERDSKGEQR